MVSQLLNSAIHHKDDLIQRIAIGLSNGLVCLGTAQKAKIGEAGVIRNILRIIEEKVLESKCLSRPGQDRCACLTS